MTDEFARPPLPAVRVHRPAEGRVAALYGNPPGVERTEYVLRHLLKRSGREGS